MNKNRRKRIETIIEELECLMGEEQDAFDNTPESLQETERGEAMESHIENLDETISTLKQIVEAV